MASAAEDGSRSTVERAQLLASINANLAGTCVYRTVLHRDGRLECLYVSPTVHALHAEALKGLDAGKSCIRFRKPGQIDLDLLDRLLADTVRLDEASG